MYRILILIAAMMLTACQQQDQQADEQTAPADVAAAPDSQRHSDALAALLDAQPEDVKARYRYRHPKETLEFIGIEPGMTVVEGLPGRGWYSKLLVNYLGSDGVLIGADYSLQMYPLFPFGTEEFIAEKASWVDNFEADADSWRGDDAASLVAFHFGSMPERLAGTADVVFFPRVLHNLARFQNAGEGDFLDQALADAYAILAPGGVLGVVQHHARDDMSDAFADGSRGYLKRDWVIAQIEAAGFEFVAESDINANDRDQPAEDDIVWRLPPSYATAGDDPDKKAAADAIGESNRMTLKFRKPG